MQMHFHRKLPIPQEVKKEFSLKVCTEVANPNHVEQCLASGIDALWIGARTTTNPFSVQDIAEALNIPLKKLFEFKD